MTGIFRCTGGVSDPFQPCERYYRMSYNALRVFAETKYPFVVSTKGRIIAEPEYLELLKKCNCVVQISMVCAAMTSSKKAHHRLKNVWKLRERLLRV